MSKRRKSRRPQSAEMEKVASVRRRNQKSMAQGLEKLSTDFKPEVPPKLDEEDFGYLTLSPTLQSTQLSWWQQAMMPAPQPMSMWITPTSFMIGGQSGNNGVAIDAAKLEALKSVEPHKVTQRIPDYVEVITAWRAWTLAYQGTWQLRALGVDYVWKPKEPVLAQCNTGFSAAKPDHPAPAMNCNCGVWAFKDLDRLVAAIGNDYGEIKVLGQVSLWGRVIETENGYRAEKAYPSELWLLDPSLEELGLIYDVPVRCIQ